MHQAPLPLGRGDRVVNFGLPDAKGTNRVFYLEVAGGPIVLLAYGTARGTDQLSVLTGLASIADTLRESGTEIFAVSGDDVAANRDLVERLGLDFPLFSDQQGVVLPELLAPQAPVFPETKPRQPQFAIYVLDPNQRVLEVLQGSSADNHQAQVLDSIARWAEPDGPRYVLHNSAPVLNLDNVFDSDLCRALIEAWKKEHQEGGVSDGSKNLVDYSKKRNLEHVVMDPDLSRRVQRTMARRIGPELVKVFNYSAPYRFEGLTVLSYRDDRQDFFGTHRDNLRQTRQRRFAISLNLNEGYEGGALRFPEYGPHSYRPPAGAAVIFSCALLHEALPVTKGQRWVLTTFMCDPDPDQGTAPGASRPNPGPATGL